MSKQTTPSANENAESQTGTEGIGSPTRIHRVSPWPPFVAAGFAVAEIGIVLNLVSLAIGGIILFGGSVSGILNETKYAKSPWRPLLALGAIFVAFGGIMWASQVQSITIEALLAIVETNTIAMRGEAVVIAGSLLVLGAIGGRIREPLKSTE